MTITNFLQKRRTVRDFLDESLTAKDLARAIEAVQDLNEEDQDTYFRLFTNGQPIYEGLKGKAGYSGVMIQAPHYIALKTQASGEDALLATGYNLEKLNTRLVEEDIGTCWITMYQVDKETKRELFGPNYEDLGYLIALGYAKKRLLFDENTASPRLPVSELVFKDELGQGVDMNYLENLGLDEVFSSVRFAPSHMNTQPWRFLLEDGKVTLYMKADPEQRERNLVDMGVVMFYFQELAKTKGVNSSWSLIEGEESQGLIPLATFAL